MSRRRLFATAVAVAGVISTGPGIADAAAAGRYIVVLEKGSTQGPAQAAREASAQGAKVSHVYRHALRGYAATLPDALLAAQPLGPLRRQVDDRAGEHVAQHGRGAAPFLPVGGPRLGGGI